MLSVKDQIRADEIKKTKVVKLFNPTSEDFTVMYGGIDYTIASGSKVSLPVYLAEHIAKHLTDKRLLDRGKPINSELRDTLYQEVLFDE